MDKWHRIPCNVCGWQEHDIVYYSTLPQGFASGTYAISAHRVGQHPQLVRCRRCGLIYANPQPADLESYYAAWGDDESYKREADARLRTFDGLLARLERYQPGGMMLDVGCATGLLLSAAQSRGWFGAGVEPSTWAAQEARDTCGMPVFNGVLATAPFAASEFDAVTMVDVIEHLANPTDDLSHIYRILRVGGVLLVTTPDIKSWPAKILRERWWATIPTHLYYFTPESLSALLNKTGFRVLEVAHVGRIFSVGYWGSKFSSYNEQLGQLFVRFLESTGLSRQYLKLNFWDQLMAIAIKEG